MNYKLLLPSYRQRYLFVKKELDQYVANKGKAGLMLNLGTGEGDYDPLLALYADSVIACDINEAEVEYARHMNAGVQNLTYQVEDATKLTFANDHFDVIVSTDVIEHVSDAQKMVEEISRVLKPGGTLIITYPQINFPWTYDPFHRLFGKKGKILSIGAYGYNHHHLIKEQEFESWSDNNQLVLQNKKYLSRPFAAIFELYWPGIFQKIFKANASNETVEKKGIVLRPSIKVPALTVITDFIIRIDNALFKRSIRSVGIGYRLEKKG